MEVIMSEKLTLEKATEELEALINELETNPHTFREGIEICEQACEKLEFCYKELDYCKGKVVEINNYLEQFKNKEEDL